MILQWCRRAPAGRCPHQRATSQTPFPRLYRAIFPAAVRQNADPLGAATARFRCTRSGKARRSVFIRTVDIRRQRPFENIQHQTQLQTAWRAVIVALMLSSSPSSSSRRVSGAFPRREYAQECVVVEHPFNQHFNLARWLYPNRRAEWRKTSRWIKIGESTVRQRARRPVQRQKRQLICVQAQSGSVSTVTRMTLTPAGLVPGAPPCNLYPVKFNR